MKRDKWVWMPHAGHLIVGDRCKFHLNTYVGKHIVSTVGEYWPERSSREIHAEVYDPAWLAENKHLLGDAFDHAYFKKFGYETIGADRKYETMVFKSAKSTHKCCPHTALTWTELDFLAYNKPEDAFSGHIEMCNKWSKKIH